MEHNANHGVNITKLYVEQEILDLRQDIRSSWAQVAYLRQQIKDEYISISKDLKRIQDLSDTPSV